MDALRRNRLLGVTATGLGSADCVGLCSDGSFISPPFYNNNNNNNNNNKRLTAFVMGLTG